MHNPDKEKRMFMPGVNALWSDCDQICLTTSGGSLARSVFLVHIKDGLFIFNSSLESKQARRMKETCLLLLIICLFCAIKAPKDVLLKRTAWKMKAIHEGNEWYAVKHLLYVWWCVAFICEDQTRITIYWNTRCKLSLSLTKLHASIWLNS